jgi:hypothetical protein
MCAYGNTWCANGPRDSTCTPYRTPEPEICDNRDNDCDGSTDEGSNLCRNGGVCIDGECRPSPACDPNPCTNPPSLEPYCSYGGDYEEPVVTTYVGVGECISSDDGYSCHYDLEFEPCEGLKVCEKGQCVAGPNPCDSNPCTTPPEPVCLREGGIDLVRTYSGEKACSPTSSTKYQCNYPYENTYCKTTQHCVNAQCI